MINDFEAPTKELLARVDERTKAIQTDIAKFRDDLKNSFYSLSDKIRDTETRAVAKYDDNKKDIEEIKRMLDKDYTKKNEFDPIKKIVYGFVGFLLLSIGGMFIAVIARPQQFPTEKALSATAPPNVPPSMLEGKK